MTAPKHLSKPLAEQYLIQGKFLLKFSRRLSDMGLSNDLIRAKRELGHGVECFGNCCLGSGEKS